MYETKSSSFKEEERGSPPTILPSEPFVSGRKRYVPLCPVGASSQYCSPNLYSYYRLSDVIQGVRISLRLHQMHLSSSDTQREIIPSEAEPKHEATVNRAGRYEPSEVPGAKVRHCLKLITTRSLAPHIAVFAPRHLDGVFQVGPPNMQLH